MNTTVDFKADFDARFPDFREIRKGDDRAPGRPVAEMIKCGLRERGFETSEVENNEPAFSISCRSGEYVYWIDTSLSGDGPVWEVNCYYHPVGWREKLWGRRDEKEIWKILEAIEAILKKDKRVHEARWFREPQFEAFSEREYGTSPRSDLIPAHGTRRLRLLLLLLILGLVSYFGIVLPARGRRDGPGAMKLRNEMRVKNTSAAIEQFHVAFNRWPTNLSELLTNSMGPFLQDGLKDKWNHDLSYTAPTQGKIGRVGSYGRDGREGGSSLDEDFFVKFTESR